MKLGAGYKKKPIKLKFKYNKHIVPPDQLSKSLVIMTLYWELY